MSVKGLSFLTFYNSVESSTATYVWCGLAAIVLVVSYVVHSAGSKKGSPPKCKEQNGGVNTAAVTTAAGDVKSDRLVNGVAGRSKAKPASDQGLAMRERPVPPDADVHANADGFVDLQSSVAQGCEVSEPRREGALSDVDGGVGQRHAVLKSGWKGEGPHEVHLLESGWTEDDLDAHQRPIEVYTWFSHHQPCECSFELEVILQDNKRKRIAKYQHGPVSYRPTANVYKKVSLIFENYGAGVRYVTYSHRRRKNPVEECKGHRITEMYSGLRKLLKINNLN